MAALERRMALAVADEDFEAAAKLRDEIAALKVTPGTYLKPLMPGAMGLGTSQEKPKRPKGWVAPAKPDMMTSGHKPGGRRTR
jgi:hypothetical protein